MFTVDPSTGEARHIVIEAAFGQGEVVVSGQVEPDTYVVDKEGPRVLAGPCRLPDIRDRARLRRRRPAGRAQPAETGAVVSSVTTRSWGWRASGWRWRPTTSHRRTPSGPSPGGAPTSSSPGPSPPSPEVPPPPPRWAGSLVQGLAASSGRASGVVRVLGSPDEGERLVAGEILVAPMTSPDWVPTIRRAAALVTDGGGMTCHAAIVARELGVPCVVGARNATTVLRDGELVTVDGALGTVAEGAATRGGGRRPDPGGPVPGGGQALATRIYVNLAFAEHAEEVAAKPVDGVGLLRAEFMVTDALGGVHPAAAARAGRREDVRGEHGGLTEPHHQGLRASARRVPQHRLPDQRVPQSRRGRAVRATGGEPDDRLPRLLPVRARARPVPPGAAPCWPRCSRAPPTWPS